MEKKKLIFAEYTEMSFTVDFVHCYISVQLQSILAHLMDLSILNEYMTQTFFHAQLFSKNGRHVSQ